MKDFYDAVKDRRSMYAISDESPISNERIVEIVEHAVTYCPTAFNSQSARTIILFNDYHKKMWQIIFDSLKDIIHPKKLAPIAEKINSFMAGYGTILFYEDTDAIKKLQQEYPTYQGNFPIWSNQSNGMLQYIIWTSLSLEGLGASLQHYIPIADNKIQVEFNIPKTWKLIAQMPFGKPWDEAEEKEIMPVKNRVRVYK